MKYIKSLDGIRGIAILVVILFHFGYLPFGWMGVQIFFTLSGFLITSILISDRDGPFLPYIGRFYWRRTVRIFPLYYFFLALITVLFFATEYPRSFSSD